LNLELKDTFPGALPLIAVVADQVAENLGVGVCIHDLNNQVALTVLDASDVLRQVFVVHLQRRVGPGFAVSEAENGLVTVAAGSGERGDDGEEPQEPVDDGLGEGEPDGSPAAETVGFTNVEPENRASEEKTPPGSAPSTSLSPSVGGEVRRRGRPPGSKNKSTEAEP